MSTLPVDAFMAQFPHADQFAEVGDGPEYWEEGANQPDGNHHAIHTANSLVSRALDKTRGLRQADGG